MKMKRQYTVLIDMDDTIEDLLIRWVNELNCKHNTSVSVDDITDWDLTKFFPTLCPDEVYAPLFDNEFWKTVQPKDDASRFIKALKDEGYSVYICTTSNYKTLKTKMENVLFKHFDFLSWSDVIITSNKQLINADFLVDDGVHNLIGGSYQGILMDAPHNRKFNEKEHDIIRVKSWDEIYNIIKRLTQED